MALHHGVRLNTSMSLNIIEDWCEANCKKEFMVTFVNMTDDLRKKTVDVFFEDQGELNAFKAAYKTLGKAAAT